MGDVLTLRVSWPSLDVKKVVRSQNGCILYTILQKDVDTEGESDEYS